MKNSFRRASDDNYHVPSDFLEKYPLVKKALDTQRPMLFTVDPVVYKEDQPRMLQILEDTVYCQPAEKEALMVSLLFASGPFCEYSRSFIEREFGTESVKIAEELQKESGFHLTKNTARIHAVQQICEMEKRMTEIFTSDAAMEEYRSSLETPTAKKRFSDLHQRILTNIEAPYLKRMFQRTHMSLQAAAGIISFDASSYIDERPDL